MQGHIDCIAFTIVMKREVKNQSPSSSRRERTSTVSSNGTDYSYEDAVQIQQFMEKEDRIVPEFVKEHAYYNTFECIASALHKLILEGERLKSDGHINNSKYDVFSRYFLFVPRVYHIPTFNLTILCKIMYRTNKVGSIPSADEVLTFVGALCLEALMEYECVVVVLIYLRRLIKGSKGQFVLLGENWEDVFLSCCVLSNKIWDDFHISNSDYCTFLNVSLKRINRLEQAFLCLINYRCNVSPHVYSRCHLRIQTWQFPTTSIVTKKLDPVLEAKEDVEKSSSRLPVVDERLPTKIEDVEESEDISSQKNGISGVSLPKLRSKKINDQRKRAIFQMVSNVFSNRSKFSAVVFPSSSP